MVAAAKKAVALREKIQTNLRSNGLQLFQGGDFQLDGTITCPARYQAGAVRADRPTILRQGPPGSGPMFRLPGADMQFSGQLYLYGNGVDPIIEVEGNTDLTTGWHKFTDLKFLKCPKGGAFKALKGHYEYNAKTGRTGKFIEDEMHADNCTIRDCHFYGQDYSIVTLDNQQALNWQIIRGSANAISADGKDWGDIIAFECVRGGMMQAHGMILNCPRFTWLKTHGMNPNTNVLVVRDFFRDLPTTKNQYLRLFDDSLVCADDPAKREWAENWRAGLWQLRINGWVPGELDRSQFFTTERPIYNRDLSQIDITPLGAAA